MIAQNILKRKETIQIFCKKYKIKEEKLQTTRKIKTFFTPRMGIIKVGEIRVLFMFLEEKLLWFLPIQGLWRGRSHLKTRYNKLLKESVLSISK